MLLVCHFILGDRHRRDFLRASKETENKEIVTPHETRHPPFLINNISLVIVLFLLSL